MYQKYQTDAIVLRSYERGEADRIYALYTQEFGALWARASAVRREGSKMRYGLQNYTHARVSLVRGSGGWRLVGARALASMGERENAVRTFVRISALVDKLAGEERNDYLFRSLAEAHAALRREPVAGHATIELLCVARILYALGYVSAEALGTALFTHAAYGLPELAEAEKARSKLLSSVNRAISETHL
jgi:recombinational DNA repair protein (RecF pathway)